MGTIDLLAEIDWKKFTVRGGGTALAVGCSGCDESFCWGTGQAHLAQVVCWARDHQCAPQMPPGVLDACAAAALEAFKSVVTDPVFYPWQHCKPPEKEAWRAVARAAVRRYLEG